MTLPARIEAAEVPTYDLFCDAFGLLRGIWPGHIDVRHQHYKDSLRFKAMLDAEAWTSAAEMLVPPTFRQTMDSWDDGYAVGLWRGGRFYVFADKDRRCAHPSLALLAAILRAERKDDE